MKRQTLLRIRKWSGCGECRNVDVEDIIAWRDEVGLKKGVVCDDGKVIFNEWPVPPHEQIVSEFNTQFVAQSSSIFSGTPHYPVVVNNGTTGIHLLSRMNLTSYTHVYLDQVEINNHTLHGAFSFVYNPLSLIPWPHSSRSK